MPVATETLRNIKRVNVWFAVSAVLALVSTGWMIWHDYNRPWRHFQRNFFNVRSAMAHMDALKYETPAEKEKYAKLLAAVEDAKKELATDEKKALEKELLARQETLAGELQGVALTFGNRNAEMQVRLFDYEEARALHGEDDPRSIAIKKSNDEAAAILSELKSKRENLEDELRSIKQDVKRLYSRKSEAQKALAAYEKGLKDAERFDKMYGPGLDRFAFNVPLLDYLAPSGTPGHEEVRQVFMKPIRFDYNFVDSYVTDRCVTCHVGIDDPTLTVESFVRRTGASLENPAVQSALKVSNESFAQDLLIALGEAANEKQFIDKDVPEMSDDDREKFISALIGAANSFFADIERPALPADDIRKTLAQAGDLTRSKVMDAIMGAAQSILWGRPPVSTANPDQRIAWKDMSEAQRQTYTASITAALNTYLVSQGRPRIDFSEEIRAHPRLDLYVSADSPHSMTKIGCTVCHEGAGQDTDFILAAHTPKNKAEKKEWEEKYYTSELGVPLATFHLVEEFWERPMLPPQFTSASCKKCHQQIYDLERDKTIPLEPAHNIVEGRDLFTSVGCINCHNVDGLSDSRRVGTDLSYVAEKLTQGFMERWVEYPGNFRPSTWMPHFFHQENNLPSSANEFDPDPVLRTETEIQAIVHYLRTFSKPLDMIPTPEGMVGDPTRGEQLFTSIGCLACHANLDAKDPQSSDGKSFGELWITRHLVMSEGLSEDDAKSRYDAMSKTDRARYATHQFTPERRKAALVASREEEVLADREGRDVDPKKMYVPPAFTRVAPELSGIGTKLIDDPNDAEQSASALRWLYNWLHEPRHYSSYTRMPRMFRDNYYQLDDAETQRKKNNQDILDVATYLLGLRNDEFDRTPIATGKKQVELTQSLILDLLGGQNTASVSEKILNDEKGADADPYGRLTASIVAQTYRSFGDGDEGKQRVAELIATRSGSLQDRQKLFLGMKMVSHYGCYACHTIAGFEDATRPGTDVSLWAQKFMSQLDFAFYSPPFEHEVEANPAIFGKLYIDDPEYAHLVRDAGGNAPAEVQYNHASFAWHKMRNPRIWDREKVKKSYEKLKMPNYFLSEEQARAITTYLLSMRDANVMKSVQIDYENTPAGKIAAGRALARDLNCIGCHTIEGDEANIHQYYTRDTSVADSYPFGPRFRPPLLWGEGAKIQFDWLFNFLNNVEMLRPWLNVRMPSFYLTKEQATTLVEYFAGLAQDESQMLASETAAIVKYMKEVHAPADNAPGSDSWFLQDKFAQQARTLSRYAVAKEQIRPFDLNTNETQPAAIAEAIGSTYDKIMLRSQFLAELFDVDFPYADAESHMTDDERFKRGEEFFYDLKCLACHVAGDPSVPGTTTDIKAPNFALTYKRLRHEWVVKWLEDPQAIQPGANMPQIFPGTTYHAQLGGDAQKEGEAKYGDTLEKQADILVDFLFNLGDRRYTAIQPGGLTPPAADQPQDQDVDFDFGGGEGEKKEEKEPEFDFDG
ncbi:MAG: c-type cytochrome [Planctomycetia bacterium]|nr:c-type cytochrome [Planctomycetia bacterium]MCC7315644.1 c-type cytochrome [Planctomycetota bacterium]